MAVDNTCYLDATCDIANQPFESFLAPVSHAFTTSINGVTLDFSIFVIWGIVLGIIWFRTHSTSITGIIGIFLVIILQQVLPETAVNIGYLLLAISIGVMLYQLVIKKPK